MNYNYIIGLILLIVLSGCSGKPDYRPPEALEEYMQAVAVPSLTHNQKSELTINLARKICPSPFNDVVKEQHGSGYWHVNALSVDLDGEAPNEQILLFWDDSEYYAPMLSKINLHLCPLL